MKMFAAVRVMEKLGEYGDWQSVRIEYDYEVQEFNGIESMTPRIHTIINTDTNERVNITQINAEDMEKLFKEIEDGKAKEKKLSTGS